MGGCDSKEREELVDVEDDEFYQEVSSRQQNRVHTPASAPIRLRSPPACPAVVQNYVEDGSPKRVVSKSRLGSSRNISPPQASKASLGSSQSISPLQGACGGAPHSEQVLS
jgi:hypothetical protein